MPVYMIRAGESGPVKIGHSHDPEMRLGQLQISHWEPLRIIRQFVGGEAEEFALHGRFADLHIRGEWHSFSRAMLGDVGLAEILPTPTPVIEVAPITASAVGPSAFELGSRLMALRKSRGLSQAELASEVRVSRATIGMIEVGRDFPGRALLWRLDVFFGANLIGLFPAPDAEDASRQQVGEAAA